MAKLGEVFRRVARIETESPESAQERHYKTVQETKQEMLKAQQELSAVTSHATLEAIIPSYNRLFSAETTDITREREAVFLNRYRLRLPPVNYSV